MVDIRVALGKQQNRLSVKLSKKLWVERKSSKQTHERFLVKGRWVDCVTTLRKS